VPIYMNLGHVPGMGPASHFMTVPTGRAVDVPEPCASPPYADLHQSLDLWSSMETVAPGAATALVM